jgi:hypothetical protein
MPGVKTLWQGRVTQAATKYGEAAPNAAVCCNACRTCVQTNLISLGLAAALGASAWLASFVRREKHA